MEIAKVEEKRESKNRPVATNFQFLKIFCPLVQLLVGACLPQTLLETSTANGKLTIYQFLQFIDKPADMKSITYRMMNLNC